jgi:hypothetical protein
MFRQVSLLLFTSLLILLHRRRLLAPELTHSQRVPCVMMMAEIRLSRVSHESGESCVASQFQTSQSKVFKADGWVRQTDARFRRADEEERSIWKEYNRT